MSFTRSFLAALGLSKEQENAVMDEHTNVVDGFQKTLNQYKTDAEKYKAEADKLAGIQKELDSMKDYQAKYESEHSAFETYKQGVESEKTDQKVKAALGQLCLDEKINPKRVEAVVRLIDRAGMKLTADGKLENEAAIRESIKKDFSDYITTDKEKGANPGNPPDKDKGGFSGMSLAEKMAYANQHPDAPEVKEWLSK